MSDPLRDLERIAAELAPCSTLLVAPPSHPLAARFAAQADYRRCDAAALLDGDCTLPRQQLALVADTLERLTPTRADALLALLRDRLAETLYCLADPARWPPSRMLALGLQPLGRYPRAGGIALYHFDLYDYKRTPDWLNARNWANPEQWNKHRW
ncbi:DUF6231 family protein [Acidihalobacter ferrooxydans]|uniref:Uncharacterized protein n=1 Tax=Acidihalobacter ferrooxydans TaxID=1765967 RepID=A0A1P8UJS6_9GAMM|nr:DUF6231 family protein [Acidihalobacter ferrooxydans]APZ44054.1 hypothetical protein BW247_13910 [Acidihalobacter ferrooxydans]